MITENQHLLRDPELSSVNRNCQIYIMPLDTLKIGFYKLKEFMNCIKVKRNNLLNSIYSSVSPDFRFKETPFVNFFTDRELSSSLYNQVNSATCTKAQIVILVSRQSFYQRAWLKKSPRHVSTLVAVSWHVKGEYDYNTQIPW